MYLFNLVLFNVYCVYDKIIFSDEVLADRLSAMQALDLKVLTGAVIFIGVI
tara:strand:+ start:58 stop:210 length:153 start_codon:yes stop_codon:yes gene_type:complete